MSILYVGIDLAKNVFAVHGVNELDAAKRCQPKNARARLHPLIASLAPCVIGMETCPGAHRWAGLFQAHGHTARLMANSVTGAFSDVALRRTGEARPAATLPMPGQAAWGACSGRCARWQ